MTPRLLRKQHIFTGRVFRVERHLVHLSNGRDVPMDVVRHRGSVVLVPQPAPGKVILIRQYRYVIGRWIWELPAGSLESNEAPRKAARRECEEETGWRPGRLERLGVYYATPGFCDERMVFYACRDLEHPARPAAKDVDEQITARTFTIDDAWALVRRGQIVDMKTVLGLVLLEGRSGSLQGRTRERRRRR